MYKFLTSRGVLGPLRRKTEVMSSDSTSLTDCVVRELPVACGGRTRYVGVRTYTETRPNDFTKMCFYNMMEKIILRGRKFLLKIVRLV